MFHALPVTSMIAIELPSGSSATAFRPASPSRPIGPVVTPRAASAEAACSMSDTAMATMLLPAWSASRTMYSQPRSVTCHITSSSFATTSAGRAKKRSYHACATSKSLTGMPAKRTSTSITSAWQAGNGLPLEAGQPDAEPGPTRLGDPRACSTVPNSQAGRSARTAVRFGWLRPERESWRGLAEHGDRWCGGPAGFEPVSDGRGEVRHVGRRRLMHGFGDDQGARRGVADGGPAALPVGPAPGVCPAGAVAKDHLAGGGVFHLAVEGQVFLVTGRAPHLQPAGDRGDVEDGHRDGERERDGVAQVDEGMLVRESSLLAEPPQQRLGGAPVLGGLEPHPGEGAPPGLDFGQVAFGDRGQPGRCGRGELGGVRGDGDVSGDAVGEQGPGNEPGEVAPDLSGVLKVHAPSSSALPDGWPAPVPARVVSQPAPAGVTGQSGIHRAAAGARW